MRTTIFCLLLTLCSSLARAEETNTFNLVADVEAGDSWSASVKLEVAGDLSDNDPAEEKKFSLTVAGELQYEEQIVAWEENSSAKSLRTYQTAKANIQVDQDVMQFELPQEIGNIGVAIENRQASLNTFEKPLTREQLDLINVVGNTLAIQRLLPEREVAEGENWDHSEETIGPLLGLDHVAVCEVSSVAIGEKKNHVQIRLSGTVHGTKDGAPTEMDLRGAYLFDLNTKRITKFNLAIKESRSASEVVPGLDVVAKAYVVLKPMDVGSQIREDEMTEFQTASLSQSLLFEAAEKGFQFEHDKNWFVTANQNDVTSLRYQQEGEMLSHCDFTTLPARSEGRFTSLEQYEREIREALGENLEKVTASTQWETSQGYDCLGVIALGKVEGIPIEWRYYLISADGLNRVSMAFTIEQSNVKDFNDSDRTLIESLKLIPTTATARKASGKTAK